MKDYTIYCVQSVPAVELPILIKNYPPYSKSSEVALKMMGDFQCVNWSHCIKIAVSLAPPGGGLHYRSLAPQLYQVGCGPTPNSPQIIFLRSFLLI